MLEVFSKILEKIILSYTFSSKAKDLSKLITTIVNTINKPIKKVKYKLL